MASSAVHLENRGHVVLAVTTALLVVSTLFIVLRFVSRIGIVRRVSWDDYFIIGAWVSALHLVRYASENTC